MNGTSGMRLALMIGFGGMALIFLAATIDAVHLLGAMRAENRVLREAALERSNRLESIRSSVLLTHTYLGDYLLDSDEQNLTKAQNTWSQLTSDLGHYRCTTRDEEVLVKALGDRLSQHWQRLSRAMTPPTGGKPRTAAFYRDEIVPLRTSVVEITTQLQRIDTQQEAAAEAQTQWEFERLGARLNGALSLGLGAALLLATGCLIYIFRIEGQNSSRYQEVLKTRGALEQLSARLVDAQETERRTISRELHDQVGQTLNAVLVEAANLATRIEPDDTISLRYLDNIRKFADSSVNSIRDIALLLRPSMLDDLGLIPALEWQAREVSRRTGIKISVTTENVPDSLPDDVRTCVYRVVQEALHNMSRHSGAKTAVVAVSQENGSLVVSVKDDGCGFNPQKTRGLGLLGMEERVRQLGGQFEVRSSPGGGTNLCAKIPMLAGV